MIDTRHFYHPSPAQCLVFLWQYLRSRRQKLGNFGLLKYSFLGPQNQKNKNSHNPNVVTNKVRSYFQRLKQIHISLVVQ